MHRDKVGLSLKFSTSSGNSNSSSGENSPLYGMSGKSVNVSSSSFLIDDILFQKPKVSKWKIKE